MPRPPSPETLVETLRKRGEVRDPRIEEAFLAIPRAAFLPGVPLEQVYSDEAILIKQDASGLVSSSSQPSMMAIMLRQLQLRPGHNVLEIGTGTGFNAAIMKYLVGESGTVTTIELDPQIAEEARANLQRVAMGDVLVVTADGAGGYPPRASYDRIIATAGIWDVPRAWVRQLKPRGILVAPIWLGSLQYSAAFVLQPDGSLYSDDNPPCGFIRMRGVSAGPEVTLRIGSTSLYLQATVEDNLDPEAVRLLLSEDAESGHLGQALSPSEFISSFVPFLALHVPQHAAFVTYSLPDDQQPFGIEGQGFALITHGSACFVSYRGHGRAQCFGGADMLLAVQDVLAAWNAAGRPRIEALRLRLTPKEWGPVTSARGAVFERREHYLEAWFER